ncbi:MAG: methionine/alanine import family NSS transporter small subunit [Anaerovoracaceae bacterium]|jgi:hypothetical protein
MSIDAIIMMIIGCTLLWGGFIVSCTIAIRHRKKDIDSLEEKNRDK